MMTLIYNGIKLKEKINFKKFRKVAFKYKIQYQSWEEGDYIEAFGALKKNTLINLLR
ncbi:U exon [Bat mastadenovirus WIV13]|uniref:U exon n=1 Tax=Bat mastadenovirus WIV13 TaxID=1788435 RepID=A0A1B0UHY5_9ADEN|nr:U exon [Bat mastadenovirus WIV13]AMB43039.1 U exon [Bat mastadenovirus WIV13]